MPEQRRHRGRRARGAERLGRRAPAQRAPQVAGRLEALPQPLREGGRAGVLDEEPAPAGRLGVGHAHRGRDHRPGGRVEVAIGVEQEEQQVAVAREAAPQARAEPGQRRAVAQQQAGRAEGPAREHEAVGAHLAVGLGDRVEQVLGMAAARRQVLAVAHAPAVAVAVQRVRLAARAHARAGVDGRAQVGEVDRLLGAVLAAHVAAAAQPAGLARRAVEVGGAVVEGLPRALAEGHGQRRALGLQARDPRGVQQRARLGRAVGPRVALGALHRVDGVVVAIEVGGRQRQAVGREGLGVLAQHDVGVDERPAAQPAGGERVEALEVVVLEEAVHTPARRPQRSAPLARRAREGARRPRLAALEHEHRGPRLRQAARDDRAAEARPDDDHVEALSRHPRPTPPDAGGPARRRRRCRCERSSPARARGPRPRRRCAGSRAAARASR